MLARPLMTAEELLGYDVAGRRVELVRGRLVVHEPAGFNHGELTLRIGMALKTHLEREREREGWQRTRGRLAVADPGFTIARSPDTVRAPDVAYVSRERFSRPMPEGFPELAPDLAVEVRSPNDRTGELLAKVADWLTAGTQLVWVIEPARRTVTVYRADGSVRVVAGEEVLEGETLLPGFTMALPTLFTEEE